MNNESLIINKINGIFAKSQEFLRPLVSASLFLQRFDYFILLLMILLFIALIFAKTTIIGGIAGLIIALTVLKMFFIRGQDIELTPANVVLLGFLAVCFISVFFSPYVMMSLKGFSYTLLFIGFYFSVVHFFRFNKNKIVPVIFIIMFIVSFESAIAIIQSMHPMDVISSWQDTSYTNSEEILSRVYGTLKPYNPNLLCAYLMAGISSIFTVIFWAFAGKHKKTLIFSLSMLALTICAIFLTGTRSGYIGLFIGIIVAFFLVNSLTKNYLSQKAQTIWKNLCIGFLTLAGVAIALCPAVLKRIMSIFIMRKDSSTSFRMNVYHSAWQMFTDNWFSGIGVGHDTFRNIYALYMVSNYTALSAYSIYLEIAVESGIFALLFFLAFFTMLIRNSIKFLKQDVIIEHKIIIASILIMMTGIFVQGFFDTLFFRPQIQFMFWTNIAIMSVILEDTKNNEVNKVSIEQIIKNLSDFVRNNSKKIKIRRLTDGKDKQTTP